MDDMVAVIDEEQTKRCEYSTFRVFWSTVRAVSFDRAEDRVHCTAREDIWPKITRKRGRLLG